MILSLIWWLTLGDKRQGAGVCSVIDKAQRCNGGPCAPLALYLSIWLTETERLASLVLQGRAAPWPWNPIEIQAVRKVVVDPCQDDHSKRIELLLDDMINWDRDCYWCSLFIVELGFGQAERVLSTWRESIKGPFEPQLDPGYCHFDRRQRLDWTPCILHSSNPIQSNPIQSNPIQSNRPQPQSCRV